MATKTYPFIIFFLLILWIPSQSTTYLKFWVNGVEDDTLVQGDELAWELDISVVGGTAELELYLDLDNSYTITGADQLLEMFEMEDGDVGDDGPSDSSAVPDGILYVGFGKFAFAPQTYLLKARKYLD